MPEVRLFGTLGCHLCDVAEEVCISALPQTTTLVKQDIAESPDLVESMGTRIPVVRIGPSELNWPFSEEDVAKAWRRNGAKRRYLM